MITMPPPTNPDAEDLRLELTTLLSPANPKSNSPISSTASSTNNQSDWKKFLFFKILALKQPDLQVVMKVMPKIWKFKFNDDLILLERSMANKTPDQYTFNMAELWIQFHGLPVNLLNADFITLLASNLGTVSPISQCNVDAWSLFARAKVTFDATAPLVREVEGPVGESSVVSELKYEGLPEFCRFCGRMGHSVQSCPTREEYIAMIRDDWTEAEKKVIWDLLEARLDDSIMVEPSQKIPVKDSGEDKLENRQAKRRFDDEDDRDAIQMIRNMFSSKIAKEEDEKELRLIEEEERRERMRKKQKLSRR